MTALFKASRLACLLALNGLATACGGQVAAPAGEQAHEPAPASASPSPGPASAAPAGGTAPRPDPQPPAEAASATPRSPGDAPALRPSYDACIRATEGATWAMQDCIAAEYEHQDGRLNKVYRGLMATLGNEEQATLRDAQRRWLAERDERCAYDPESGQAGRLEANECSLEMTASRATELESR